MVLIENGASYQLKWTKILTESSLDDFSYLLWEFIPRRVIETAARYQPLTSGDRH
ncbi:hypothetical protein H6G81_25880 [Scytonema hofmannii FACHB-248]|uniref:Uncharacterized protein n=1 Tax=Scytonema hofmannii FACHB-248 TaxID=1842502 RepID=A0ABR8GXL1_9CYAN|nr:MULTISPECIES: hypothetical protein [Nostocales]MBD2607855.1 hypothetical protein [Scytonema hofmannii FACHB-248]